MANWKKSKGGKSKKKTVRFVVVLLQIVSYYDKVQNNPAKSWLSSRTVNGDPPPDRSQSLLYSVPQESHS